jgi:hypothetical protein
MNTAGRLRPAPPRPCRPSACPTGIGRPRRRPASGSRVRTGRGGCSGLPFRGGHGLVALKKRVQADAGLLAGGMIRPGTRALSAGVRAASPFAPTLRARAEGRFRAKTGRRMRPRTRKPGRTWQSRIPNFFPIQARGEVGRRQLAPGEGGKDVLTGDVDHLQTDGRTQPGIQKRLQDGGLGLVVAGGGVRLADQDVIGACGGISQGEGQQRLPAASRIVPRETVDALCAKSFFGAGGTGGAEAREVVLPAHPQRAASMASTSPKRTVNRVWRPSPTSVCPRWAVSAGAGCRARARSGSGAV